MFIPEVVVFLRVLGLGLGLPEDDRVGDRAEGEGLVLGHVGGRGVDPIHARAQVILQGGDVHRAQELGPLAVYEPAMIKWFYSKMHLYLKPGTENFG